MFQKILFQIHVVLVIKESWKNASQLAQKCEAAQQFSTYYMSTKSAY